MHFAKPQLLSKTPGLPIRFTPFESQYLPKPCRYSNIDVCYVKQRDSKCDSKASRLMRLMQMPTDSSNPKAASLLADGFLQIRLGLWVGCGFGSSRLSTEGTEEPPLWFLQRAHAHRSCRQTQDLAERPDEAHYNDQTS